MELTRQEKLSNMFVEDFEVKHTFSKNDDLYEISIKWEHDLGIEYPQVTIIEKLYNTKWNRDINIPEEMYTNKVIYDEELVTKDNKELHNELSTLIKSMLKLLRSKIS